MDEMVCERTTNAYYNENGKIIELDTIEERIAKNFERIEKISISVILDIYFIHLNWREYREESGFTTFQEYIKGRLPISRGYVYDIIKAVDLLVSYQGANKDYEGVFEAIAKPLEQIGLQKLKLIAQVKDEKKQKALLSDLFDGKTITNDDILSQNKEAEPEMSKEKAEEYRKKLKDPVYVEEAIDSLAGTMASKMKPTEVNRIFDTEKPEGKKLEREHGYLDSKGRIYINEKLMAILTCPFNGMRRELFNRIYEFITNKKPILMTKNGKIFSAGEMTESEILLAKTEFSEKGIKIQTSSWDEVDKENSIMEGAHYNALNKSAREKYFESDMNNE